MQTGGLPWITPRYLPASALKIIPQNRLPGDNNYFLSNDESKWAPHCGNYQQVTLANVWEGIDVTIERLI
ncbi:MAG: hypothetical protein V2A61_03760 [Calditrichota bacterium]